MFKRNSQNIFPQLLPNLNPFHAQKGDGQSCEPLNIMLLSKVLISNKQQRVRQQRSTADLLSFVAHLLQKSLELHEETQIIALDIYKAFDTVYFL